MQKEVNSVLVCFALEEEARAFRRLRGERPQTEILITGMGRQNAERAVREFLKTSRPRLVLSCGFAGSLNPDLRTGDVVFEIRNPQSAIQNQLLAAGAKPAKFSCADRIATTAAEKAQLRRKTGADAVEMESEPIHAVCREHGIPCATVRVISDTAEEDMPLDFNRLARPDRSLDYGKLAGAIAKSPGRIGGLLKLQKQCRAAAGQLAQALDRILPA
jgi:adenosylhomocysteine nucleosidase